MNLQPDAGGCIPRGTVKGRDGAHERLQINTADALITSGAIATNRRGLGAT